MKTLHLHRPAPPPSRPHVRASIVRLGLVISAIAAVTAVLVDAVTDLHPGLVVVPVVIIGFALSWHASGPSEAPPTD